MPECAWETEWAKAPVLFVSITRLSLPDVSLSGLAQHMLSCRHPLIHSTSSSLSRAQPLSFTGFFLHERSFNNAQQGKERLCLVLKADPFFLETKQNKTKRILRKSHPHSPHLEVDPTCRRPVIQRWPPREKSTSWAKTSGWWLQMSSWKQRCVTVLLWFGTRSDSWCVYVCVKRKKKKKRANEWERCPKRGEKITEKPGVVLDVWKLPQILP